MADAGFAVSMIEERLIIPHDILGRIAEKHSRMRQGLVVAGPYY